MAAGVTDRLWEVNDLVALWEACEQRRAGRKLKCPEIRTTCYALLRSQLANRGAAMSLESIAHEIRKEIEKLTGVLHLLERGAKKTTRTRRKISAAGRKRIAAAQRKRWAKIRAGK
jgi:hypothetical protein